MHKYLLLLLFLALILASCTDNSINIIDDYVDKFPIDARLEPFVNRFVEEGRIRGFDIKTDDLEAIFVPELVVNGEKFCGWGESNYIGHRRVRISQESRCWDERSDLEQEGLMFHELGHAVLGRDHFNAKLPNGSRKSLMCGNCNQFRIYTEYKLFKRDYYLDELFDSSTPEPDWSDISQKTEKQVFEDNFDGDSLSWVFGGSAAPEVEGIRDSLVYNSEPYSLKLTSYTSLTDIAYWRYVLENPEFAEGASVKISVDIKTENLQGEGISVAIRADTDDEVIEFATTQRDILFSGTSNFKTIDLLLPCYSLETKFIKVFFIYLPNTTGSAYFDNFAMTVLE